MQNKGEKRWRNGDTLSLRKEIGFHHWLNKSKDGSDKAFCIYSVRRRISLIYSFLFIFLEFKLFLENYLTRRRGEIVGPSRGEFIEPQKLFIKIAEWQWHKPK